MSGRGMFGRKHSFKSTSHRYTRYLGILVGLLALTLLAGCGGMLDGGTGGAGTGTISGLIKHSETGELIKTPVTVSVGSISTVTSTGTYQLKNVPVGTRTLKAAADGYKGYSQQINVVEGPIALDIELEAQPTGITGTVTAPGAAELASLSLWQQIASIFSAPAHAALLFGETPFAGATVQAYNWRTGEPISQSTTTDQDGKYVLEGIPHGSDIVIIVEKDGLRLSTVVANVSEDHVADVNTVTTLASEALGSLYRLDVPIDVMLFETLLNEVQYAIIMTGIPNIDLTAGGDWIGPEFGSSTGLDDDSLVKKLKQTVVIDSTPVITAKRIISELRGLGPSIVLSATPTLIEAQMAMMDIESGAAISMQTIVMATELIFSIDFEVLEANDYIETTINDPSSYYDGFTVRVEKNGDLVEIGDLTIVPLNVTITYSEDEELYWALDFTAELDDDNRLTLLDMYAQFTDSILLAMAEEYAGDWDGPVVEFSGSIEAAWDPTETSYSRLEELEIRGSLDSPVFSFGGGVYVDMGTFNLSESYVDGANYCYCLQLEPGPIDLPERIALDGEIWIRDVMDFSGYLDFGFVQGLDGPHLSNVGIWGSYFIGGEEFGLEGGFEVYFPEMSWWGESLDETEDNWVEYWLDFYGMIVVPGHPPVWMSIGSERVGLWEHDVFRLRYERGNLSLSGEAYIEFDVAGDDVSTHVDIWLYEYNGAEIYVYFDALPTGEMTLIGRIEVDGEVVAELTHDLEEPGLWVVYHLPNGTDEIESLF